MARPKEFNESRALVAAMGLFWERGYEATGMRDLSAHTGVAISSLYATFGGKRDIYMAALTEYRRTEVAEMEQRLAAPGPLRQALADIFARLIERLMADPARRGSFTVNAANELGGQDEEVTNQLRQHFDEVGALLAERLATAQAVGEIADHFPAADLAYFLLFGLYGLAMMVKVYPERAHLERAAAVTLAVLDN